MLRRILPIAALLAATAAAVTAPAAAAPAADSAREAILVGRALLAPDASAPAPFPGAPDTEPSPAPDARQPVGGFSALLDAAGRDTFWAMPDNSGRSCCTPMPPARCSRPRSRCPASSHPTIPSQPSVRRT